MAQPRAKLSNESLFFFSEQFLVRRCDLLGPELTVRLLQCLLPLCGLFQGRAAWYLNFICDGPANIPVPSVYSHTEAGALALTDAKNFIANLKGVNTAHPPFCFLTVETDLKMRVHRQASDSNESTILQSHHEPP